MKLSDKALRLISRDVVAGRKEKAGRNPVNKHSATRQARADSDRHNIVKEAQVLAFRRTVPKQNE